MNTLMKNKHGAIPTLKTIFIMIVVVVILISMLVTLYLAKNFTINEKKINTQLVIDRTLRNCFSEEFAVIDEDKFTQQVTDDCFTGIDDKILARIILNENEKVFYVTSDRKEEFDRKADLCVLGSNTMCTEMMYPIVLRANGHQAVALLKLQIITT